MNPLEFSNNVINSINIVASLIPFPFAGNYLLIELYLPSTVSTGLWISSIVGLGIFIGITYVLFLKSLIALQSIVHIETNKVSNLSSPKMKKTVRIESTTPIKAFMKKDLSIASRDFMAMRFLIMPILLPIISVLLFPPSASITLQNYLGSVCSCFFIECVI